MNPESIVERRRRYIERQKQQQPETVNVKFRDARPMGSGPINTHGMPQLPVGQREVKNWPVLDIGHIPNIPRENWKLVLDGAVANPTSLNWESFNALTQVETVSDFHCVTTWSRFNNHWKGVPFRALAELAVPQDDAVFVLCEGYDRLPGNPQTAYTTNLPLARAIEDDVLLVHAWEGKPLPREHGGPVRMITPKLYAWKGAKWIHRITFLQKDQPGFWEVRGYSNTAEPWFNDRYHE